MALLAAMPAGASAASLQVSPIVLDFAAHDRAHGLWLTNSGSEPLRAQVRIFAWTQADGAESLQPSGEFVASPSIIEIAAGARQLVRVVRTGHAQPPRESAFRVIVDELPGSSTAAPQGGLRFLLRYSIPVFMAPAEPQQASAGASGLSFRMDLEKRPTLHATNGGTRRVRISQLAHISPAGVRTEVVPGLVGYALAGQGRTWNLPDAVRSLAPGTWTVRLNDDPTDRPVLLAPPQ